MPSYILRHIDPDLWRHVKAKAALEGVSVKALIERLLRAWVGGAHSFAISGTQDADESWNEAVAHADAVITKTEAK